MLQLDDNLLPGETYTFQFKCANWFCTDLTAAFQNDIATQGPPYVSALQVTSTLNLYNVQFTYAGDGSDVVSDVANEFIADASKGSNDSFNFIGAVAANAASIGVSPAGVVAQVGTAVSTAVNKAVNDATNTAAQGVQNLLKPIEIAVILVVVLVVILIATAGKAGGLSAGPGGISVGG